MDAKLAISRLNRKKATNSLFVHLLLIAKSSRKLDQEDIIGKHEFTSSNANPDGSLLPSTTFILKIYCTSHALAELDPSPDGSLLPSTF